MPSTIRGNDNFETDDVDFTIIYPNGGTEASPAGVSENTRYVDSNPFPGFSVICQAEVREGQEWGATGWDGDSGSGAVSWGVMSAQLDDGNIVTQTAVTGVIAASNRAGSPLNIPSAIVGPLLCRVKVWKLKGATA